MARNHKKLYDERGSVLVMTAVFLIVLMGFAALTVDVGMAMTAQAELQRAADAGALAGAPYMATGDFYPAITEARAFGNLNTCLNAGNAISRVTLGYYNFDTADFQPWYEVDWGTVPINALRVTAARTNNSPAGPLPLAFAGVLGAGATEVEATSVAAVDRRVSGFDGSVANILLPFALSEYVSGNPPVLGRQVTLYPNLPDEEELVEVGLVTPGNFGLLDLDNSNAGTSVLSDWIINGFPGVVEIPEDGYLSVPGDPGLRNALADAAQQRVGDTVCVMLYDGVGGTGSNTVYDCTALCAVKLLSVTGNGTMNLSIQIEITQMTSSGFIVRPSQPDSVSVGKSLITM